MALVLIETSKGEAYDCDGSLYERAIQEGDGLGCLNCDNTLVDTEGWISPHYQYICDNCVHVVSLEDACDAVEKLSALKNAFEFIFGASKVKTNNEIIVLHCWECKQLIKFGEDVRWKEHSYCTDCFFAEEGKNDDKKYVLFDLGETVNKGDKTG